MWGSWESWPPAYAEGLRTAFQWFLVLEVFMCCLCAFFILRFESILKKRVAGLSADKYQILRFPIKGKLATISLICTFSFIGLVLLLGYEYHYSPVQDPPGTFALVMLFFATVTAVAGWPFFNKYTATGFIITDEELTKVGQLSISSMAWKDVRSIVFYRPNLMWIFTSTSENIMVNERMSHEFAGVALRHIRDAIKRDQSGRSYPLSIVGFKKWDYSGAGMYFRQNKIAKELLRQAREAASNSHGIKKTLKGV